MCDRGWRLKKRLTMAPNAPRRKSRLVQTKCKRSSLQLEDDDPMMERAFATEGGCAPLSTSSDDEVKPVHTMARITPGGLAVAEKATETTVGADIDLLAYESPIEQESSIDEPEQEQPIDQPEQEPPIDEPIEQESVDNQPIEQESVDEQTEAVFEGDTPEEMGQPLDEE